MHLIQILLPLYNNEKEEFPGDLFAQVKNELIEKFGGITAYSRSPATGLWKETTAKTVRDEIITYEVMAADIDKQWWQAYKENLQQTFQQEELMIKTWVIELL